MIAIRLRALGLFLCILAWAAQALGQVSITYQYGNEPSNYSPSGNDSRSGLIRDGLNQAFGGRSSGTVGGATGVTIPPPRTSEERIAAENVRRQQIDAQWEGLRSSSKEMDLDKYLLAYNAKKRLEGLRAYSQDKNPTHLRNWKTQSLEFQTRAGKALFDLRSNPPANSSEEALRDAGERAIALADDAAFASQSDEASFYYSIGMAAADVLVGIDPITGTLRGVYEATTGRNLITGQELNEFERGLAVFSVVTLGFSGEVKQGLSLFGKVIAAAKDTRAVRQAMSYALHLADCFAKFRGAARVEQALPSYVKILVEASSGPWQRAEELGFRLKPGEIGEIHPELFKLDDPLTKNFNLGKASASEADAVGLAFVGENATATPYRQDPTKSILVSADERRVYRPGLTKDKSGRYQANFEVFAPPGSGRSKALSNGHLDVE